MPQTPLTENPSAGRTSADKAFAGRTPLLQTLFLQTIFLQTLLLPTVFLLPTASAAPSDRSFFKQRVAPTPAPVATPASEPTEPANPLTSVDALTIPVAHGSIKETSPAAAGAPIVIHIQDAHANYEAQKHLAEILRHLIQRYALALVLVEGGSRNDSLSYMREYAPLEKRLQVADQFLKAGKISGENYLDLTTDYDFTVYGVEKPELYDANMSAFLKVEQAQPPAKLALANYRTAVDRLKEKLYPQEVKDLEIQEAAVAKSEESLTGHYQKLAALAAERQVALAPYANVQQFLKVSELEKGMNFQAVELERGKALQALAKSLPKDEMDGFLKRSREIKKGLATASAFYRALRAKLTPDQLVEYPTLAAYCDYLDKFEAINHADLFSEVESLSEQIKLTYLTTADQKTLARIAKDVAVLSDLVEMKLIPEKHDYYVGHRAEFDPTAWGKELAAVARKAGVEIPEFDPGTLKTSVPVVEEFYTVARQRDRAMVENAMTQVAAFDVPVAVLITGGFHTPVLTDLLKRRGVSYAVVAPKVPAVTDADIALYHKVLKETYVPMAPQHRASPPPGEQAAVPGPVAAATPTSATTQ